MRAAKRAEVWAALKAGDRLAVQHPNPFKVEKECYFLVDAGRRVTAATFFSLRDFLTPAADGLFGDSQTYVVK